MYFSVSSAHLTMTRYENLNIAKVTKHGSVHFGMTLSNIFLEFSANNI